MSGIVGQNIGRGSGLIKAAAGFDVSTITDATALTARPDGDDDELLISDNGTLKRIDFKLLNQHKYFGMMRVDTQQALSHNTTTLVQCNWDYLIDTDYDVCNVTTDNWKYTCPEAGRYFFFTKGRIRNTSGNSQTAMMVYENGSVGGYRAAFSIGSIVDGDTNIDNTYANSFVYNCDADDYFQLYAYSYGDGDSTLQTNTCLFGGWMLT